MAQAATGSRVVRALRGGQITLPTEFRNALGIGKNSLLKLTLTEDGGLLVRPVDASELSEGSSWLRELYEDFEPIRQEVAASELSDEEIYALIDEAVAEVRAERRLAESNDRS